MRSKLGRAIAFALVLTFGASAALAHSTGTIQNNNATPASADSNMMKTKRTKRRHVKRRRRHVRRGRSSAAKANANANSH